MDGLDLREVMCSAYRPAALTRYSSSRGTIAVIVTLAFLFHWITSSAYAEAQYVVTDLGTLKGGSTSFARGVNNSGQVAGTADGADHSLRPFLWQPVGGMTPLDQLTPTQRSDGHGLNNLGQVVGFGALTDAIRPPVLWSENQVIDLGTFGGEDGEANAINDIGQVVGWADSPDGTRAFLWHDGMLTNIDVPGSAQSEADDINATGVAVGWRDMPGPGDRHAFQYAGGVLTHLSNLSSSFSEASAINDGGRSPADRRSPGECVGSCGMPGTF